MKREPDWQELGALLPHCQPLPGFLGRRVPHSPPASLTRQHTEKAGQAPECVLARLWGIARGAAGRNPRRAASPAVGRGKLGGLRCQTGVWGALQHMDLAIDADYLRTSDQREIELLVRVGTELWAIETRLTTNPTRIDLAKLDANANLIGAGRGDGT